MATEAIDHAGSGAERLAYVVEDDAATLGLLGDLLEDDGWEVRLFTHLGRFRRAVHERVPDLVLLDDDLPDGRGGDEAQRLRQREATRQVPILFCTAAPPARRREMSRIGAVLAKPFDLEGLDRFLRHLRDGRGRGRTHTVGI
ncbi:MAG: response regulator [Chloroflexota bacterium]